MPFQSIGALSAVLLLSITPHLDEIAFAPADGSEVSKRFVSHVSYSTSELEVIVGGRDMSDELGEEFTITLEYRDTLEVSDRRDSVAGGRPAKLTRTYDSFETEWLEGEAPRKVHEGAKGIEDIVGRSVAFEWNAKEEAYDRKFTDDGKSAADVLPKLTEDLDMRALLPGKLVSKGDEWEVPLEELVDLMTPGIDPRVTDEERPVMLSRIMAEIISELNEEALTCTYVGAVDDGEDSHVKIDLEFKGQGSIELSAAANKAAAKLGASGGLRKANIVYEFEGSGELLWDVATGQCAGMEFEFALDGDFDLSTNLGDPQLNQGMDFHGKISFAVKREVHVD